MAQKFKVNTLILSGQTVTATDTNSLLVNGNPIGGSTNIIGLISTGDADLRYLNTGASGQFYLRSNPNNFISSGNVDVKLQGLITTGSADLRYINTGASGGFYRTSNPNNFSSSGNVESTGTALQNQLGNYYLKSNPNNFVQSGQFVSGISVTGGIAIQGPVIIVGIYGTNIIQSGLNTIGISGGGGGGETTTVNNFFSVSTGSGIPNRVPKYFTNNSGLVNSNITSIGSFVGINQPNPLDELEISGSITCYQSGHFNAINATGFSSVYLQYNIKNLSNGTDSSSDLVATANIGTEDSFYVNLGINGSNYTGAYIGKTGDGYLYSQGNDFYVGNTNTGKSISFFIGAPINNPNNSIVQIFESGIVLGSSNFHFLRTTDPNPAFSPEHANIYVDNLAQRSILSYANSRGIGKMIQNTIALENVHNFAPNTTTSMMIFGTTATSAGTISHPTTFLNITGFGFCSHFAMGFGVAGGMQSATTPYYLTSGTTGLGAGFFMATQFAITGASGNYTTATGTNSGCRFFCGMTNATTNLAPVQQPYPPSAILGFQMIRSTGASGRADTSFQFVSKDNGATAPWYVQETNCEFFPNENYATFLYGRSDFRNGVHWMIKNLNRATLFSGNFTGAYNMLPKVSQGAQIFLKPAISLQVLSGQATPGGFATNGGQFLLKGMYCETV